MKNKEIADRWTTSLKHYDNFPVKNIRFFDIFAVLSNKIAFQNLIDCLLKIIPSNVDFIIGIDSRGFLFAPLIAYKINARFAPIRKMMKLPGEVYSQKYTLEYGEASIEIQKNIFDDFCKNHESINIVIVDDLIASGGSLEAAIKILQNFGTKINILKVITVLEIEKLGGSNKIKNNRINFESLFKI